MSFDIPRDEVLPVEAVDVRLVPRPHPYELANAGAIEAGWLRDKQAMPALFDGQVVLLADLAYRDRQLTGRCHVIRYATFLHWRRSRPVPSAEHSFAFPVLVSSDNALVAIRMGKHTANSGKVYFAAGSFEPADFPKGRVDLHGNMTREVQEETGLDISQARRDPIDHIFSADTATVIFRRYFLDEDAAALARRIEDFVAKETAPEIVGPVLIRSARQPVPDMTPHMEAIVRWHFGASAPV